MKILIPAALLAISATISAQAASETRGPEAERIYASIPGEGVAQYTGGAYLEILLKTSGSISCLKITYLNREIEYNCGQ